LRMRVSVDRVEEGMAVLVPREEVPGSILWPISLLPPGVREGVILELEARVDEAETARVMRRAQELHDRLVDRSRRPHE